MMIYMTSLLPAPRSPTDDKAIKSVVSLVSHDVLVVVDGRRESEADHDY